jgi:hypothetical protein
MQSTSHLLMIKPSHFGFNEETATNNFFQNNVEGNHQQKAVQEFDKFVYLLRQNEILVTVIDDDSKQITPDAIFPNNWISFDEEHGIFLYPMFAINRRLEKDEKIINQVKQLFSIQKITDLSYFEKENIFLEGTGSMVLDRVNKIAYACLSPRTNIDVLNEFCQLTKYTPCAFTSTDKNNKEIYHTNVMMCVAEKFVVICLESIKSEEERNKVIASFQKTNHEIIDISFEQMNHFAGNMLEVSNADGQAFVVMSNQALASLNEIQLAQINKYDKILAPNISTIETIGGGGVRCMMAEVFLSKL